MKQTAWLIILALVPLQSYAKGMKGALKEHQSTLAPTSVKESGGPVAPEVTAAVAVISSSNKNECVQDDQNSIPLSYLSLLLQQQEGQLNVNHDARSNTLRIDAPKMISNCATMLDWGVREQNVAGKPSYVVEVAFKKKGVECTGTPVVCDYQVAKVSDGTFEKFEKKSFPPTLVGFEQCLEFAGVLKDEKIDTKKIYSTPLLQKFPGVKNTADILFVSNGTRSKEGAKFGDFVSINNCDHYENIGAQPVHIVSFQQQEEERRQKEAAEVEKCGDYNRMTTFIDDNTDFKDKLEAIRDNLIVEAAKKAAKNINEGKYDDKDLEVIGDFAKYIVDPRVAQVTRLYQEAQDAKGEEKDRAFQRLADAKKELDALNARPFFVQATNQKLIADGKFEDSKKLYALKVTLDTYSKLGNTINNIKLTPEVANKTVVARRQQYAGEVANENERYEIKQGRVTGTADEFKARMNNLRQWMITRNASFQNEIAKEQARVSQGGACFANSWTTERCVKDSMLRIQQLQKDQAADNEAAQKAMAELDAKQKDYAGLELQGKRYIASKEGTPLPEEPAKEQPGQAGAVVAKDGQNSDGSYNFNYQNGQPQGQPGSPDQQALLQQQAALNAQIQLMQQQMMARSQGQFNYQQSNSMFGQPMYQQPQQQSGGIGGLLSGLFNGGGNANFQANYGYNYGANGCGQFCNQGFNPMMQQQQGYQFNYAGNQMAPNGMMNTMPFYGPNQYNLYPR